MLLEVKTAKTVRLSQQALVFIYQCCELNKHTFGNICNINIIPNSKTEKSFPHLTYILLIGFHILFLTSALKFGSVVFASGIQMDTRG